MKTWLTMKDAIMSDAHEVNEIGRWYDMPIFGSRMNEFMTKWLLTNEYDVDNSEYDEHIYFNYACNKHYINSKEKNVYISLWHIEIAPNGREYLNKGENNE